MTTTTATGTLLRCGRKHTAKIDGGYNALAAYFEAHSGRYMFCECGATMKAVQVIGRVTETRCGARCTSAIGPVCDCECGGQAHGEDHR